MNNKNFAELFRKYSFYIGVGFLTVILIIIFRQKKLDVFVQEGKESLASFYTQNLKPLIYTNEITNEDVFNFAMVNSLPINKKENRILFVSQNDEGKNSITIRTSEYKENTDNYRNFVNYLELDSHDKKQLDSLLSYYKAKLYSAVLANDKNTVAVNQNIPILRELLYADILHFANTKNYAKARQIYTEKTDIINPLEIKRLEEMYAKNNENQDFLLMNKDSIFTVNMSTDIPSLTFTQGNQEAKWRDELNRSRVWANEDLVHNIEQSRELQSRYSPSRHNNEVNVVIPSLPATKELEKALQKLKNMPKLSKFVAFGEGDKKGKKGPLSFKMNFDFSSIDSMVTNSIDAAMMFVPQEERDKIKKKIDSALSHDKEYQKLNKSSLREQLKNASKARAKKTKNYDTTGND
jgi:hypothetical protein